MKLWCGLDTETELTAPGNPAPEVVCATFDDPTKDVQIWTSHQDQCYRKVCSKLSNPRLGFSGMNIAFDFWCLMDHGLPETDRLVIDAYEDDAVVDLMAMQRVIEIAGLMAPMHKISLEKLAVRYGLPMPDKASKTREDFGWLKGEPLSAYPREHKTYALYDAVLSREILERQLRVAAKANYDKIAIATAAMLSRDLLWLKWTSNTGLRTDKQLAEQLGRAVELRVNELKRSLEQWQLIVKGSRNEANIRAKLQATVPKGIKLPLTPSNQVSLAKDSLALSRDPEIVTLAEYNRLSTVLSKDIKILRGPSPIHCRYGIADTFRLLASNPNTQNFARDEVKAGDISIGVRQCFIPPEGFALIGADHGGLELAGVAQRAKDMFGGTHLLKQLLKGIDPLSVITAHLMNKSYEWVIANKDGKAYNHRQAAKSGTYGMAGGMSKPQTLQEYALQSYGVALTIKQVRGVMRAVLSTQPDIKRFLAVCKRFPRHRGRIMTRLPATPRALRACFRDTQSTNTQFQTLGSRVEGLIGWSLLKQHLFGNGAMREARPVIFAHDEFILQAPVKLVTEVALELQRTMQEDYRDAMPDVPLKAKPCAMWRWEKKAQPVWVNGRLKVWEARKHGKKHGDSK